MRWKWKLGLLLVVAMESPILAWGGLFLHLPAEGVGYLAAILTALLFGMLVLRPTLFALAGLWLFGICRCTVAPSVSCSDVTSSRDPYGRPWARSESNRRSRLCKSRVIATRPRARTRQRAKTQ